MTMTPPRKVGVVGVGLMGSGIAEVCARAGLDVVAVDAGRPALQRARARITASLDAVSRRGGSVRTNATPPTDASRSPPTSPI